MKKWIYLLATTLAIFTSQYAIADCTENLCSGVGKEAVASVYVTNIPEGVIYLEATSGKENLKCQLVEGRFMTLKKSHPLFKETYSLVLTALASNKRFYVRIIDNSSVCEVLYVRMYN